MFSISFSLNNHKGNSVAEYALPIAIVGMVIFALLSLTDLGQIFQTKLTSSQKGTLQDESLNQEITGHLNPGDLPSAENLRAYYRGNGFTYSEGNTVCLGGTNCIAVPNIPEGVVAEVDGTLGGRSTHQLAAFLQQIAQQLAADGADRQLQNLVQGLANKGHQMADSQLSIFEYASNRSETYKNSYKYNEDEAERNDPTQTRMCINDPRCEKQVINTNNTLRQLTANTQEFSTLHQQLNSYLQSHPKALEGIPGAAEMINQSANRITEIQRGFKLTNQTDAQSYGVYYNYATNPGQITRFNANTICTSGEGGEGCHRI